MVGEKTSLLYQLHEGSIVNTSFNNNIPLVNPKDMGRVDSWKHGVTEDSSSVVKVADSNH